MTDAEIQGKVTSTKQAVKTAAVDRQTRIDQLMDSEKLERARSNSLSFRDNLEGLAAPKPQPKNGLYLQVTGEAVKVRVGL